MNRGKIQIANIREQCGWVTKDKEAATGKAKALIQAAIKRSVFHEILEPKQMECNTDIVVIGGGIAGIEAALMAAEAGRKVVIIEKDISLGGNTIKTEEVAPYMECAPCLLAPRLSAVKDHANITVVSHAEVTDLLGFFGNFTVKVHKKARYVNDSCIGCEACFEVCPVSVSSDFHMGMGNRKAIYTAFPGSVPAVAVIDKGHCKHFLDGSCDACVSACPFQSIQFDDVDEDLSFTSGAVIVATGYDSPNPAFLESLGYGSIDNVCTTPEFERMASSNGPFGGTVQLKNGEVPASVAVIHCAASLREDAVPYCSGICCMTALKVGELLRKTNPQAMVYNLHDRLVFNSPANHAFYLKQKEKGVRFLPVHNLPSLRVLGLDGKIQVSAEGMKPILVDMLVLSTGLVPSSGTKELAEKLHIDRDGDGFFKPGHSILQASGSTLDGIYMAGCCSSPCDTATAITRAQSAAGTALSKLVPGKKIELEMMTTFIDEEICAGCKLCIAVCPYKAITFDPEKRVSVVNEAICRGCGTCAATCPGGAATAKHFTDEQIYAELGGLLHA